MREREREREKVREKEVIPNFLFRAPKMLHSTKMTNSETTYKAILPQTEQESLETTLATSVVAASGCNV